MIKYGSVGIYRRKLIIFNKYMSRKNQLSLWTLMLVSVAMPMIVFANETGQVASSITISEIILALIFILLAAKIGGEIFEDLGQPAVLGELIFGIILGNAALLSGGIIQTGDLFTNEVVRILADLGVMILLFQVGLESNIKELLHVGATAVVVAFAGVFTTLVLGFLAAGVLIPEAGFNSHLFIGATLTATSVGISARVLKDLGKLNTPEAKVILGAAVADDILGLIMLSIVSGIVVSGSISLGSVVYSTFISLVFLAGSVFLGIWSAPKIGKWVSKMHVEGMKIVTAFLFMFIMAYAATLFGLATIIGAFAAGLVLDDVIFVNKREHPIDDLVKPLYCIFVPIFFVLMGAQVDLSVFFDPQVIMIALAITIVAILGKQACALAVRCPRVDRLTVGIGMVTRGEVELIFAGVGRTLGVINDSVFAAIVIVVVVTTLITPPLLKWSIQRKDKITLAAEVGI